VFPAVPGKCVDELANVTMAQQQIQQGSCVAGVVLGAGRTESLPVPCGRSGVHGKKHQMRVFVRLRVE
jgi:hypothetical protein